MKHIKAVHNKVKTTCDICHQKVSVSNISFHKKKYHGDNQDGPTYQQTRLDKVEKEERRRLAQKKYYEKNKERIIANVVRSRKRTEKKEERKGKKIIQVGNKSLQVKLL